MIRSSYFDKYAKKINIFLLNPTNYNGFYIL